MRTTIKASCGHFLVIRGGVCIKRFDKKTDAEKYVGRYRDPLPVVVERTLTSTIQPSEQYVPDYKYRIAVGRMVNGREQLGLTEKRFEDYESAEREVVMMNSNPKKKLNVRYKIATLCASH